MTEMAAAQTACRGDGTGFPEGPGGSQLWTSGGSKTTAVATGHSDSLQGPGWRSFRSPPADTVRVCQPTDVAYGSENSLRMS